MGDVTIIPPDGGIHLPLLIGAGRGDVPLDDEELAVLLLERYHLAMHPGYLYGIDRPALVMSYLGPERRIAAGLDRLRACLDELHRRPVDARNAAGLPRRRQ
jgi:DNA-binding transcriptional MocR family regulator